MGVVLASAVASATSSCAVAECAVDGGKNRRPTDPGWEVVLPQLPSQGHSIWTGLYGDECTANPAPTNSTYPHYRRRDGQHLGWTWTRLRMSSTPGARESVKYGVVALVAAGYGCDPGDDGVEMYPTRWPQ